MSLSLIACTLLSTLCLSPYQGEKAGTLRVEKSDTLPEVLTRLSAVSKKKIVVDGTVSVKKLGLEGDFTQEALIAHLKDALDYDYVAKEDAVVFFKSFARGTTRPDFSLPEITASLKQIKTIVTPMLGGRTREESPLPLFFEAVQELGPEERKLLENEEVGFPIARLSPAAQQKITEAIHVVEYKGAYSEFSAALNFIEKLDSMTVARNNNRPVIEFKSENGAVLFGVDPSNLEKPENKTPAVPDAFALLKDTVAQDAPDYSFKLGKELEEHSLYSVHKAKLSPNEIKMVSELNRWNVRPEAKDNATVYSVSWARPGASSPPFMKVMEALPASVSRYLMGPLTHIDKIPVPETRYPGSEYEKLRHRSIAQQEIPLRAKKISDSELLTVAEWVDSKPAGSVIPVKEMPSEVKRALINGLLMRTFFKLGENLVTRALWPSPYLQNPEKYNLVCIQGPNSNVVSVMGVTGGGGFSIGRTIATRNN